MPAMLWPASWMPCTLMLPLIRRHLTQVREADLYVGVGRNGQAAILLC